MQWIFRALFLGLLAAFTLGACAGERATPIPPTEVPIEQNSVEEAGVAPVEDERTARPQFLNSYASW